MASLRVNVLRSSCPPSTANSSANSLPIVEYHFPHFSGPGRVSAGKPSAVADKIAYPPASSLAALSAASKLMPCIKLSEKAFEYWDSNSRGKLATEAPARRRPNCILLLGRNALAARPPPLLPTIARPRETNCSVVRPAICLILSENEPSVSKTLPYSALPRRISGSSFAARSKDEASTAPKADSILDVPASSSSIARAPAPLIVAPKPLSGAFSSSLCCASLTLAS